MELKKHISDIISGGLLKATDRLYRISGLKWQFDQPQIGVFKPDDEDVICSYLTTSAEEGFSGILAVADKDKDLVFKAFSPKQSSFYGYEIYEFFINELGNIILNSILSEFANKLKIKIIPNSPKTIKGKKDFIIENILSMIEKDKTDTVICIKLSMFVPSPVFIDIWCFVSSSMVKKLV